MRKKREEERKGEKKMKRREEEGRREKKREKERKIEKKRYKERNREKKRQKRKKKREFFSKERQLCPGTILFNLHSILKKKKLNILAEMLEISKSACRCGYTMIDHRH